MASLKSSIASFFTSMGIPVGDQTKGISAPSPEGSWRGPFFGQGELGGWHQLHPLSDGWQRNLDITGQTGRNVPSIYGCVMAIARAVSQCDPIHVRRGAGKNTRVTNSAAYRVMNNPNEYQTTPGFILNLLATALFDGEAFAIGYRNDRNEIKEVHQLLRGYCRPYVAEDGAVFYAVGTSDLAKTEPEMLVPARDIIHLRFFTPRSPLIGESAIVAAAISAGLNIALSSSQFVFYSNMNRPSGILSTEQTLTKEQAIRLREAFEAQSASLRLGGLPVLSNGLKFVPMGMTSQDAQLVDAQRMTVEDICRVFGVPPPMIGQSSDNSASTAEALIHTFLSMGLGSYLKCVEKEFSRFFGLTGQDSLELDTSGLIRTDFAARVEAYAKGTQGGIFQPDEARDAFGLGSVPGGDNTFMQRQMVPISLINDLAQNELAPTPAPNTPVAPVDVPANDDDIAAEAAEAKAMMKHLFAMRQK